MPKTEKLEIDGTIRSLTITERRKKDKTTEMGQIVVMNKEGDSVVFNGPKRILDGHTPEEQVVCTLSRANQTIAESTKEKGKK